MAVAGIALVVAAGCVLVLGAGLKRVIDAGFSEADAASLDRALFALLAIVCVLALATYTRFYSVSGSASAFSADIRRAVFGHLLEQRGSFGEPRDDLAGSHAEESGTARADARTPRGGCRPKRARRSRTRSKSAYR